ncbi:MAG: adenylosuccinate lyase, partial [Candidatus Omnitrophica bacterium]|nr:adenylosuccinate lyase [Candidatus Omnitrophota bacterium]
QRDLTGSTVIRNLGSAFGYFLLSLKSVLKGLNKIEINAGQLAHDLNNNWELLAEPIQTLMRVRGEENPYEKLKSLTRGQKLTEQQLASFIDSLENVSAQDQQRMKALTPAAYLGLAVSLVDQYFKEA